MLPYQVMAKPVGPLCNLHCTYCYYRRRQELFGDRIGRMPDDVLAAYVEQYLAQDADEVTFCWQGGEPTLAGIDFYERALDLQRRYRPPRTKVVNAFQTNGLLIDREWASFLTGNGFLTGLSIDGPQDLHDVFRRRADGSPSWRDAMRALGALQDAGAEINALVVVNSVNAREPLRVYRFLRSCGVQHIQFIPCVERATDGSIAGYSVGGDDWGRFLTAIFDEWVRRDVGRVFVQLFEVMLGMRMGLPAGLCTFARTCGRALVLEHNGDVFSCDHFVTPQHRLGNILDTPLEEMVESDQQRQFGEAKRSRLPAQCLSCDTLFWCWGECPRCRVDTTPSGEPGLNHLCSGYRAFFRHAGPTLQMMADRIARGLPPLASAVQADERTRPALKVGRNDPCPCGSGRKYKRCCGAN